MADNKPGGAENAPAAPQRDIQGEGNYDAARKFDADERAFIAHRASQFTISNKSIGSIGRGRS